MGVSDTGTAAAGDTVACDGELTASPRTAPSGPEAAPAAASEAVPEAVLEAVLEAAPGHPDEEAG